MVNLHSACKLDEHKVAKEAMNKKFRIVGTVSHTQTLKDLLKNPEELKYCDAVELRFDQFMDKLECLQLCKDIRRHKQILLTIRTEREGGTWDISDSERFKLFEFFAPHVDMIDIELKSELFATHKRNEFPKNLEVVTSFHNYDDTPSEQEITSLISSGKKWGADIIKLAVFTHNSADVKLLETFLSEENICLIGMGPEGLITRTGFPLKGSVLTYGFLDNSAAPGQVSAKELSRLLN